MYTFNSSNLSFEEWVRLNEIDEPYINNAIDTIAEQEIIINEQEQELYELEQLISSLDIETIQVELDLIDARDSTDKNSRSLDVIERILNNFKLRVKETL